MTTLIIRTLRDRIASIFTYSIGGLAFAEMYVAMFPSIQSKSDQFSELFSAYPEEFMKVFGMDKNSLIFDSVEKFISIEHFSIVFPILLFSMFIGWGGSAIAGEIDKNTLGFLLSKPLSRIKIFFAKYFAGIIALLILLVISILGIIPLAEIHNVTYKTSNFLTISLLSFFLGLAVLSMSMFFSTLFNEKGKTYFITTGLLITMYVLNVMPSLKENLADLKYGSFFYYYDYQKALLENKIEWQSIWVFVIITIIFTIIGAWWFNKRDISV
ncbi:MAG: hypothetical protein UR93_C0009G0012 [Berkelbacteria bacterium GW2011_GWA2_35_9]|uniref:ABC-2 type transport system permease protein n=1 Tax=Berkelbacteria bacterium GW2011_GWA2_35_9 TaxID=1618333 RepID=A0A0G0D3H3_9BACT|nr:MAG: hypothetical protein UR93_C0009G0012 [Berkelbacteria bacterium GW2011_GWA2_35_9]